jgi:hypothetical protein
MLLQRPRLRGVVRPRDGYWVYMNTSSDQKEPVVEPVRSDEQPNELTARALSQRIRQQELLAELGVLALQRTSFDGILNHTARTGDLPQIHGGGKSIEPGDRAR